LLPLFLATAIRKVSRRDAEALSGKRKNNKEFNGKQASVIKRTLSLKAKTLRLCGINKILLGMGDGEKRGEKSFF